MTIAPIGSTTSGYGASAPTFTATTPTAPGAAGSTTATTPAAGAESSATTANPSLLDRDAFLKLLVAQLRYQDPNKPMDSAEMVSQSASLSVVDKLDSISKVLSDGGVTNRLSLGSSIIGKQITFTGPDNATVMAVASAISFDGASMVVRAGTYDVPLEAIRSVTAPPVAGAAAS